jgi:hypothetical protein
MLNFRLVLVVFVLCALILWWRSETRRDDRDEKWAAPFAWVTRAYYGSSPNSAYDDRCGAVTYYLSPKTLDEIRRNGLEAFPQTIEISPFKFASWAPTPVASDRYGKFIKSSEGLVGLECSGGSWIKEWSAAARSPGGYYATSDDALLLVVSDGVPRGALLAYNRWPTSGER